MPKTKRKQSTTLPPETKLLIGLGHKMYCDLKRNNGEEVIDAIQEMVNRGDSPDKIQRLIIGQFPHVWVESQQVKAVAWYLKQGDVE